MCDRRQRCRVWMAFVVSVLMFSATAHAGGVSLGATRVIYPASNSQATLKVKNNSEKYEYLVQSWIENSADQKTEDFIITPPLFVIKAKRTNSLRIIYAGQKPLPEDRESLYWVNVKAIPPATENTDGRSRLQLAVLSRIKFFYRPANLPTKSVDAPGMLRFRIAGNTLNVNNPTPYYVTLVDLSVGGRKLENTMAAPKQTTAIAIPGGAQGTGVKFKTVDDYGATTAEKKGITQ